MDHLKKSFFGRHKRKVSSRMRSKWTVELRQVSGREKKSGIRPYYPWVTMKTCLTRVLAALGVAGAHHVVGYPPGGVSHRPALVVRDDRHADLEQGVGRRSGFLHRSPAGDYCNFSRVSWS